MISLKRAFKERSYLIPISITILMACGITQNVCAQNENTDTLSLTMKEAEKMFLEKNLDLLSQHYNIEASKALVQQAKLWDDPQLITDQNIYADHKWFQHGTNPDGTPEGQIFVQVQQLIKTAGKRGKQIGMANTNTRISEWQLNEVMQQLKFQLRSDYYTLSQLMALNNLYQYQFTQLKTLIAGMNAEFKAGNIARKDLLRVQALQISLEQDNTDNLKQIEDMQSELKTLLQLTGNTFILPIEELNSNESAPAIGIASLIDTAKTNNASYILEQFQLQYQNQNLAYQKALAVPDITVSPSYDQNSNYAPNYVGLGLSLPLPILNGNRGNIKAAKWQVKQEEATLSQADVKLKNQVLGAYHKYLLALKLHTNEQKEFYNDYQTLQQSISDSYKQRQISLLEFIDYFKDYEDVRSKQLQQQLDLRLAKEELNLQLGASIF
jgi:cobalt-zinc-cadmium efflux system outer membrane protein